MKTLTLHCECGATQLFKGENATAVMASIDAAGWQDQPDVDNKFGLGHMPALCPTCWCNWAHECDQHYLANDLES